MIIINKVLKSMICAERFPSLELSIEPTEDSKKERLQNMDIIEALQVKL